MKATTASTTRTICFRIPENEYALLKRAAIERDCSVKGFIENLAMRDLDREPMLDRFQEEDVFGRCRTVSFQVSTSVFRAIKERQLVLEMSLQDYMKTLIYWVTHEG